MRYRSLDRLALVVGCGILLPTADAAAQRLASAYSAGMSASAGIADEPHWDPARRMLKADLRKLVAQERVLADDQSYSAELARLFFEASDSVDVRVVRRRHAGWAAKAVHAAFPGRSCVVWVGESMAAALRTEAEGIVGPEGVPACDADTSAVEDDDAATAESVREALRRFALAQQMHLAQRQRYAERLRRREFVAPADVGITVLAATKDGWSAVAWTTRRPEWSCVLWTGVVADKPLTSGGKESEANEIVCDAP